MGTARALPIPGSLVFAAIVGLIGALSGLPARTLAASSTSLVAAVLPNSRSVAVGTAATAFATVINSGSVTATGCTIAPTTNVSASFLFQTTNPATNALTGTPNSPVDIAAGASQSFVIALTATAAFASTDVAFAFACTNAAGAPSSPGLNTLLLTSSASAEPDIVALAATVGNTGTVNISGNTGNGSFAVAAVNVGGVGGAITASADVAGAELPVVLSLCQTVPATGQCSSASGPTVSTTINPGDTPTFAVFVAGTGAIPFAPATSRIFVRFRDGTGATRGSTGVAVQTINPGPVASFAELTPAVFSSLPPTTIQETTPTLSAVFPYSTPRLLGWGNVCGNHRNDIVAAPSFGSGGPPIPIEIWCNNGDGTFANRTADVLADTVATHLANNVFVADLNGDGIADIFIVDQGWEIPNQPLAGSTNHLLLSGPDGKLHDASATLPVQYNAFNHVSAMADFNGDGCPDFLITELGSFTLPNGVYILLNDCLGHFTKVTSTLPIEIVEQPPGYKYLPNIDYQVVYHAGAADLNGDGVVDLITGSGGTGDVETGLHTLRIFDGSKGYAQAASLPLPDALFNPQPYPLMGIVALSFGDLFGDGMVDVVANVETTTAGVTWLIIYKNLGNFSFEDVTLQYLPSYQISYSVNGAPENANTLHVSLASPIDINLGCDNGHIVTSLPGACLYLNQGAGQPLLPWSFTKNGHPATTQDIQTAAPSASFACGSQAGVPLFFDIDGDGVKDAVLIAGNCLSNITTGQTSALQTVVFRSGTIPP
jgi:hypothetical protein